MTLVIIRLVIYGLYIQTICIVRNNETTSDDLSYNKLGALWKIYSDHLRC